MPSLLDRLKVPVLTVFISLLLLFLFTKVFGPIPFSVTSLVTTKADLFTVEGTGDASGVPSTAQFAVGVTKTGTTVAATQDQVNIAVTKITTELKKLGIDEKDIKTSDYAVNPNVDYNSAAQTTTGYTVTATMNVSLKDAANANKALDTATANGATTINGVSFVLSDDDKTKLEDTAREEAIKNAKTQAEKISQQAGIKLGRVINVTVNPTSPGPISFDKMSVGTLQSAQAVAPTELAPGENKVSVSVSLSYETL